MARKLLKPDYDKAFQVRISSDEYDRWERLAIKLKKPYLSTLVRDALNDLADKEGIV